MGSNIRPSAPPLDVYAQSFVPHLLTVINHIPATVIASTPVRWIDFPAYVSSFAGFNYLLPDAPPPDLSRRRPLYNKLSTGTTPPNVDQQGSFAVDDYHAYFQTALIEEAAALQQECDDHALYMAPLVSASYHRDPRPMMYWLHVPGLRELSLRIEIGDLVQLRQIAFNARGEVAPGHHTLRHDAVVWGIDRSAETLTLNIHGLVPASMRFNIRFTVQAGRVSALYTPIMAVQRALTAGPDGWLRSMLFPLESDGGLQRTLQKGHTRKDLYDDLLNYEQVRAVDTVLINEFGRVPYLISGPPGTGKTKTLVEIILQITTKQKSTHLLVCAPSDPAADTLVQRLSRALHPQTLLRLNAPSRNFPEVPGNVLPFCCVDGDMFSLPLFRKMMQYRVVVTTCRDADILIRARLSNADLYSLEHGLVSDLHPDQPAQPTPPLHWTGLLMDEAAQATEPEAVIPISIVAPPPKYDSSSSQLPLFVMAGDQNQLGPRTASNSAALQTSLFQRLLTRALYAQHPLARSKQSAGIMKPLTQAMLPILRAPFANLIRNYRSHPAILATPSALFYADTLEPEASNDETLTNWACWRGRKWPVLFACNSGADEIEKEGGGSFNRSEAATACRYAHSLIWSGLVAPGEVCIMSPFRAQVRVLRLLARDPAFNMHGVSIGPLEAFQGLEARVVILCTTRTRDRFLERDRAKGLGVIHEPKRFNVALTRAKEGLIVIGNPVLLQTDGCWASFLAFCHRNGLWQDEVGREQVVVEEKGKSVISRLERQLLRKEALLEERSDGVEGLIDRVRRLGVRESAEAEAWRDGVDAEGLVEYEDESDVNDDLP